jgi:hypothetical protein
MLQNCKWTVFPDVSATHASEASGDLIALLTAEHTYPSKAACPLFKLAAFGTQRTPKGSLRHDANILSLSGLVADYDAGQVSVSEAAARVEAAGIEAFFYTSASHTQVAPRWRVVAPFSAHHSPDTHSQFMGVLNEILGGILSVESFTASQSYYFGRVAGALFESRCVTGLYCIDQAAPLYAGMGPVARAPASTGSWADTARREVAVERVTDETIADLRGALAHLATQGYADRGAHPEWDRIRQSLMCLGDVGRDLFVEFSKLGNSENKRNSAFERFYNAGGGDRSTYTSVFHQAQEKGWANPARARRAVEGAEDRALMVTVGAESFEVYRAEIWSLGTDVVALEKLAARISADAALTEMQRESLAGALKEATKLPIGKWRVLLTPPKPVSPMDDFDRDGDGAIIRTQKNVNTAVRAMGFRYDSFTDQFLQGNAPIDDNTYTLAIVGAEMMGCQAVSKEQIRAAVHLVGSENTFDSAQDWERTLVWDGVSRVETSLSRILGLPQTEYLRIVSRYLWTALAGRVIAPGVKADAVPVFISANEGMRKTTLVEAFAPTPSCFGELDMAGNRTDIQRMMRGKMVLEWNELAGLKRRDREHILSFLTRRTEEFVDKFKTHPTRFERRCVIFGTSNDTSFVDAHTTARRFLPIELGEYQADVGLLVAEREQLWAEGAAMFRAYGVEWQYLEVVAAPEREVYREDDPLELYLQEFIDSPIPATFGSANPVGTWGEAGFRIANFKKFMQSKGNVRLIITDVSIAKLLREKLGFKMKHTVKGNYWERN